MGIAKKELEEREARNENSGILCWRCNEEIPFDELRFSEQSDGRYICSHCRDILEKTEKE